MDSHREPPQTMVEQPPSGEFVAIVLGKLEVHVRAGNWAIALRVIKTAAAEWAEEVREQRAALTRSPEEWLERPLGELALLVRTHNYLEEAGCGTIRDAIELLNSGAVIAGFGPAAEEEFWRAVAGKKITVRRKYFTDRVRVQRTAEEQAEFERGRRKFNPPFETGFKREV